MLKGEFGWGISFLLIVLAILSSLPHQTICQEVASVSTTKISLPGCPDKCGDVDIPYPFGIGDKCHYHHLKDGVFYNITCNHTRVPSFPTYGGVKVVKITLDGEFRVSNYISYMCFDKNGMITQNTTSWISVTRFALSTTQNIAGAIGCDTMAVFSGTMMSSTTEFLSGCITGCFSESDVSSKCEGLGCCQASIPDGVSNITLKAGTIMNHTYVVDFNPCSVAFVVAKDHLQQSHSDEMLFTIQSFLKKDVSLYKDASELLYPAVYDWSIGTKDCKSSQAEGEQLLCKGNTKCVDDLPGQWGYRCECKAGFNGINPYLHDCQDINECADNGLHNCEKQEYCHNTPGSYRCQCPQSFNGNGTKESPCVRIQKKVLLPMESIIILGVGGGIIVFLLAGFWFHWQHGNKKMQKLREKCFQQNGGHILQQKLSGRDVSVGSMVSMFTIEQLQKATDNYSDSSIIGRGGFGMVFKGILPNNQVVAIKKSLKVDSTQVEQFINEVVALSQINNKNVVKLLGCCLETEVPLLVYEFISNGTLHDHLHDEGKVESFVWDIRLRIAAEVAEVLAYLHTTISIPIIHRDIKSANILLDDKCTAKVADFGASKLAPVDREQLGTMVQGTCGYLDPEYMQTGELTDKSDVYSFGVVLVELLTREKAICYAKPENERSLAVFFLRKLREDRLFEILDENIVSDGSVEQLKEVANLARRCLKLKGEDRPAMKEVARELERITAGSAAHPWSANNTVLLKEESEHLLGDKADDFNNGGFENDGMNYSSSSQSRVVQLVPLDDGR